MFKHEENILSESNMAVWSVIIVVVLVIIAAALGAFLYYQNQVLLQQSNQDNLIYPFSVNATGPGSTTTLQCPVGRVISVIDAWYELYDPNFQCTLTPTACAPAQDTNGNPVFPTSACTPEGLSQGSDATAIWGEIGSGDTATYIDSVCQYDKYGMPLSDDIPCVSMNALGYLANAVNGQNKVAISGAPNGFFGPAPCDNAVNGDPTSWPLGGAYNKASPDQEDNIGMGYSGYYGHGIYACVLEDEV